MRLLIVVLIDLYTTEAASTNLSPPCRPPRSHAPFASSKSSKRVKRVWAITRAAMDSRWVVGSPCGFIANAPTGLGRPRDEGVEWYDLGTAACESPRVAVGHALRLLPRRRTRTASTHSPSTARHPTRTDRRSSSLNPNSTSLAASMREVWSIWESCRRWDRGRESLRWRPCWSQYGGASHSLNARIVADVGAPGRWQRATTARRRNLPRVPSSRRWIWHHWPRRRFPRGVERKAAGHNECERIVEVRRRLRLTPCAHLQALTSRKGTE